MINEIYLDMDGVLCDFDSYIEYYNVRKENGKVNWGRLSSIGSIFWANMPVIIEGYKLYNMLVPYCKEHNIILGIMSAISLPCGKLGKRYWLEKTCPEIDKDYIHLFNKGKNKWTMSAPNRLLIDDNIENCELFKTKSVQHPGQAIQFNGNAEETFNAIVALIDEQADKNIDYKPSYTYDQHPSTEEGKLWKFLCEEFSEILVEHNICWYINTGSDISQLIPTYFDMYFVMFKPGERLSIDEYRKQGGCQRLVDSYVLRIRFIPEGTAYCAFGPAIYSGRTIKLAVFEGLKYEFNSDTNCKMVHGIKQIYEIKLNTVLQVDNIIDFLSSEKFVNYIKYLRKTYDKLTAYRNTLDELKTSYNTLDI